MGSRFGPYGALIGGGAGFVGGGLSGGGGKKGGSAQSELPPGFKMASGPAGKMIRDILKGKSVGGRGPLGQGIEQGLNFYRDIFNNPDLAASLQAYRDEVADPTRLTNPLFVQEKERLAATLNEQAAGRGGLYSTGAQEAVSRGLSDFTNRYLTDAATRRLGAAQGLAGQTFATGEAAWNPFRFLMSAIPGLAGGTVLPPPQYNNQKSSNLFDLARLGISAAGRGSAAESNTG